MLPEIPLEEYAAALDETADEVLTAAGVRRGPVDAFALATALGIVIARDDDQPGRARYVRVRMFGPLRLPAADDDRLIVEPPARASIWLRDDPRDERRQWAVAHELGEHASQRVFRRLGVDPREARVSARETIANQLANRLLLPSGWFVRDGAAEDWDLLALKRRYPTASHELIARRMLECGPAAVVTICDQGRINFRRGPWGRRAPPLGFQEREVWQAVHHDARPLDSDQGTTRIRGWPIHEAGWRREILRSELLEADEDAIDAEVIDEGVQEYA